MMRFSALSRHSAVAINLGNRIGSSRFIFSRIGDSFRRKKTVKLENDGIDLISRYCNSMQLLCSDNPNSVIESDNISSTVPTTIPTNTDDSLLLTRSNSVLSTKIANSLKEVSSRGFGVMEYSKIIEMLQIHIKSEFSKEVNECIAAICNDDYNNRKSDINAYLRLQLFQEYLISLNNAMAEGDVKRDLIDIVAFEKMIDLYMFGSTDDRIRGHLSLYGEKLDQFQFQSAFHTFCDPEIATASKGYLAQIKDKAVLKKETKEMKAFERIYLLDTLELNTKVRCVFCWNDPTFRGFVALPDETLMPVAELIESRTKYFKEASQLSSKFMADYLGKKRAKIVEGKERRENIVKGIFFFFGVVIADNLIAIM